MGIGSGVLFVPGIGSGYDRYAPNPSPHRHGSGVRIDLDAWCLVKESSDCYNTASAGRTPRLETVSHRPFSEVGLVGE